MPVFRPFWLDLLHPEALSSFVRRARLYHYGTEIKRQGYKTVLANNEPELEKFATNACMDIRTLESMQVPT